MLQSLHAPPEIMELNLTAQGLGFGAGVVMSVLLLRLLGRSAGNQSNVRAKYFQAATVLMWNFGGLLCVLLPIYGSVGCSLLVFAAAILHFSGAAFFPAGFLALWRRPFDETSPRTKACRCLCHIAIVQGTILTATFIVIALDPRQIQNRDVAWEGYYAKLMSNLVAVHVAVLMALGAALLLRGRLNGFAAKFYVATTLLGATAPALMFPIQWQGQESPMLWYVAHFIKLQAPLLVLLGAIVFFADFRFSNVYVKSCLRFLTALLLALAFIWLMIGPLPKFVVRFADYPMAGLVIFATALLVLFLWGFIWLNPKINRMIDRRLFREPDYAAAARQLWDELSPRNETDSTSVDEAERISQVASRFVRASLDLEEVRVVSASSVEAKHLEARLTSGEVCDLTFDDPVKWKLGASVELLAPVRVKGSPTHLLAISPGDRRRQLLDSEISFVRTVAGQLSSRFEALQFEKEKADRQNKEERLRRQITEAELRALRAQINPHFLFNSLNTIADLITTDPEKGERMTVQLARVFRHLLSQSDRQMITVGEEMEFLRTYLEIEAVRFGERLRIQFDVDREVTDESVPSLILQPVVENALKHGLAHKIGSGTLMVSARRQDDFLRLTVEDDGLGFPRFAPVPPATVVSAGVETTSITALLNQTQKLNGNGVGLRNISERLATLYSGRAKILFEGGPNGGSRVTLLLPCSVGVPA